MEITNELITELEALAKIRLTDGEKEKVKTQLAEILDYADILCELDTSGVVPSSHPFESANALREDTAGLSLTADEVTASAPETQDGYFAVPRVFSEV